jgi:hypothetical protein
MFSRRTRLVALAGAAALAAAIALPASPAEAQGNCAFSTRGTPCYLENWSDLFAAGDTHGGYVTADGDLNGTRYIFEPFGTYGYIETTNGGLCWNIDPPSIYVGLDSCQLGDDNELYAMVPCPGGSWCIYSYDYGGNYKLYGYANGDPLEFEDTSLGGGYYWEAYTIP